MLRIRTKPTSALSYLNLNCLYLHLLLITGHRGEQGATSKWVRASIVVFGLENLSPLFIICLQTKPRVASASCWKKIPTRLISLLRAERRTGKKALLLENLIGFSLKIDLGASSTFVHFICNPHYLSFRLIDVANRKVIVLNFRFLVFKKQIANSATPCEQWIALFRTFVNTKVFHCVSARNKPLATSGECKLSNIDQRNLTNRLIKQSFTQSGFAIFFPKSFSCFTLLEELRFFCYFRLGMSFFDDLYGRLQRQDTKITSFFFRMGRAVECEISLTLMYEERSKLIGNKFFFF